ncbi:MAG: hypothetical protein JW742_03380 [Candidatus Aminicenantes bacterium]|nr:hypothetical protein [Candidatus Aminicenantes bacterium]
MKTTRALCVVCAALAVAPLPAGPAEDLAAQKEIVYWFSPQKIQALDETIKVVDWYFNWVEFKVTKANDSLYIYLPLDLPESAFVNGLAKSLAVKSVTIFYENLNVNSHIAAVRLTKLDTAMSRAFIIHDEVKALKKKKRQLHFGLRDGSNRSHKRHPPPSRAQVQE